MHRAIGLLLGACAACAAPAGRHGGASPAAGGSRVVVVSIDGLMPDAYLDPDAHGLKVPTLRKLVAAGASARVHGVMPTVTYPSHTTLVTGVPPAVHGIVTNTPLDPLGKNMGGWRWYAEDIAVPTLYQAVEAQHRMAALINWPVAAGAHASIVVPEYWRAGGPEDQKLLRALSTPGFLDEVAHAQPGLWQDLTPPDTRDHAPFTIARYVLATRRPDLMLVHAFQLDDAQHEHGPWSEEAKATIEAADHELGTLVDELEQSPDWPRTTFVLVSDHGFAPIEHEIRLAVVFAKHGLIRFDDKGAPTAADVAVLLAGGTALVHVLDPAKRAEIDAAVAELGDHIAQRIDHDAIVALGGDPKADFALVAAPLHGFSDARTGDPVADIPHRGTHGWPPSDPQMAASFIAYGPHVPHVALGTIDMTAIAPTLAAWLGVALPRAQTAPIAALVQ